MPSEIVEHPSSKARQGGSRLESLREEASPPVLEGEVEAAPEAELDSPVLERLHALVRKGYRPEIGDDTATDIIVLRHVGKAPDLVLHSNGEVEGYDGRRPRYKRNIDAPPRFAADKLAEQLRFMKFLDSVPKATLRDRTRRWRQKYIYFPLVMAILLAIHLAFTAIILDDGGSAPPAEVREIGAVTAAEGAARAEEAAQAARAEAVRAQAAAAAAARAQAAEAAKAVPPAP